MQVDLSEEGDRLVARPTGRLDAADGPTLADAVQQQLGPAIRAVSIDLSKLDAVSLGGVRSLLQLGRSLKGGERGLDFISGGESVRHALDHAGFGDLFPFTPPLHLHRGHHDETP